MICQIYAAPTAEPVTLTELKNHLRIDSGTLADNLTEAQSIVPKSHAFSTGDYNITGTGVEVVSDTAIVFLNSGTNQATGTVNVKIQESDDNVTYTDWTGGAFTQITTANDNAIYEKEYTGGKPYIRTVAKVLLAQCVFSTMVVQYAPTSTEDDELEDALTAARVHVEQITGRQLMTATWDYSIQAWPEENFIKIPFGNLVSVTSIKWKDTDGTETTLTVTTDYLVETNGDECGRIVLPYGESWPSETLYPSNPITIRFVCGYTSAANVPKMLKMAVLLAAQNIWLRDGEDAELTKRVSSLVKSYRLHDAF